ncbi:MAG: tripartite tricarboxylate transporter TctB family protein [Alphaproteobacteria bacterium]|nr:tripartite tricarboxylate transporter TctB family protein [Alphaproteobacteria bacterium]
MSDRSSPSGGGLVKGPQDFLCGLMFISIGVLGVVVGWDYPRGTPVRLGTGVFPAILSWGLIGIGVIVAVKGLLVPGPGVGRVAWRPVLLIGLAAALFAVLIETGGLIAALVVMMILAALAGDEHTIKEFSIFAVIMIIMAWAIFVWGLEMPLKVFPWS